MNAQDIKTLLEQSHKIYTINGCLNKERFKSYAQAKYLSLSERDTEALWRIWETICSGNFYQLQNVPDKNLDAACVIAEESYNAIAKGAYIKSDYDHLPMTAQWKIYYRQEKEGDIQTMELDLRKREDAIKYALLLQQENAEILLRTDFHETIEVNDGKHSKVHIYDGDIIFCNDSESLINIFDESGAYVCCDNCYKRLLYTAGRGYLWRDEPNYELDKDGNDCRYNQHVFNGYGKTFRVVGNIYVNSSILVEEKEEEE